MKDAPVYADRSQRFADLESIACYGWFSSTQEPSCIREPILWRTEFVELALGRWIDAQQGDVEPWLLVLYHMIHITQHCNLGLLQRLARFISRTDRIPSGAGALASVKKWLSGRKYAMSEWHAKALLKVAQRSISDTEQQWGQNSSRNADYDQITPYCYAPETLHFPVCVYSATLVLWYGSLNLGRDEFLRNAPLEHGIQILGGLKMHLARSLGTALMELKREPG
ncbi:hypothetical protein LTR84_004494 [Exophiala bonariae]|uniref:Transcription factor domain-containing protein n=1 Tax=Exophiala bonariae TaxID=1690606 RepID=A0AAV9N5M7_9EURO|nr:hypothetical protein LTR84_004494 [Exophiala bonariae]